MTKPNTNAAALPAITLDTEVQVTTGRKVETFRIFDIMTCSAGNSTFEMERGGWEPKMYSAQRVNKTTRAREQCALLYRNARTGEFVIAVRC